MEFRGLEENLRRLLLQRIEAGHLSGLQLARETGFQQPHISNFLNAKRGLSLDALDRVLEVQRLSIVDLLDQEEVVRYARIAPPAKGAFEDVLLVEAEAALQPRFSRGQVVEVFKVRKSFLRRLRAAAEGSRAAWQRFLFVRANAREGLAMYPRLLPGAYVLLDRHYNIPVPYRLGERSLFAVLHNRHCYFRYIESKPGQLLLRPENVSYPAHIFPLAGKTASDYIVGRVCAVQIEI